LILRRRPASISIFPSFGSPPAISWSGRSRIRSQLPSARNPSACSHSSPLASRRNSGRPHRLSNGFPIPLGARSNHVHKGPEPAYSNYARHQGAVRSLHVFHFRMKDPSTSLLSTEHSSRSASVQKQPASSAGIRRDDISKPLWAKRLNNWQELVNTANPEKRGKGPSVTFAAGSQILTFQPSTPILDKNEKGTRLVICIRPARLVRSEGGLSQSRSLPRPNFNRARLARNPHSFKRLLTGEMSAKQLKVSSASQRSGPRRSGKARFAYQPSWLPLSSTSHPQSHAFLLDGAHSLLALEGIRRRDFQPNVKERFIQVFQSSS